MKAFKRKFGLGDYYEAMMLACRALLRRKKIDPKFTERLMLAVTEVNGCEACSCADSRARPDREAHKALVGEYGEEKAGDIVAAVQVMHAGNTIGLPFSALMPRLRGKPYANSSLLSTVLVLPLSAVHALLRRIGGRENIRFAAGSASQ